MNFIRSFASDNNAGVHPAIMQALSLANHDHTVGYGDDPLTEEATALLKDTFGDSTESFLVFNGTAANVLSLISVMRPYHAVICSDLAHINVDECGAPEHITGNKIITIPHQNGKITPDMILPLLHVHGVEHHAQPKVISISQTTEVGTVYTPDEIKNLADFAHTHTMLLHIDGARFGNAAAALGVPLKTIFTDTGADILSFGGTKNGLMFGEAVVFRDKILAEGFKYTRKQNMQLMSKMRFISAQFVAYLKNELWLTNARHANSMAKVLESKLRKIPAVTITQPVEANGIFAIIPPKIVEQLRKNYFFYTWDEQRSEVRFMASFDTTESDIDGFIQTLASLVQ